MVKDYVIIGAGISGLTLALEFVRAGKSIRVIEGSNAVGGLAKSIPYSEYSIDFGPHLYHSAHPEIIDYWKNLVGESLVSKDFYSGNYRDGKIYDYPVNTETAKEQYSTEEYNKILDELSEVDDKQLSNAENYHDYVRSLAGDFLANQFFTRYPKKLWGIDTKELSARFAPRRIEIREKRLPFHSGPGRFAGIIEGGCGLLAEKMKDEIISLGGEIILNSKIVDIVIDDKKNISRLLDSGGTTYDTDNSCVISTIPITGLCELLSYPTDLYFRHIMLVNIVIRGSDPFPKDYDWLYFDDEDVAFHRVGVQTRFSRQGIQDGIHILCCEIAFNRQDIFDVSELEKQCIGSLSSMQLLNQDSIIKVHSFDIGPVYPGYYVGHELELNRIFGKLGMHRNLYQTGSLADYAYSDQQVLTAKSIDLARELLTLSSDTHSELIKPSAIIKPSQNFCFGRSKMTNDPSEKPYVIAEIGLCHNGSVELCKELISISKDRGFSSAKIQTYQPGRISKKSRTSRYFEETLDQEESISDQIDKLIFSECELLEIFEYANSIDFDLFSTPFDVSSANILNSLDVPGFKISSMDLVNIPLIKHVAKFGKPVILSTGMATVGEIESAIDAVLSEGNKDLAVLHCVSSYPCPIEAANLSRINLIRDTFGVISGFSDHTVEDFTPAFSMTLGARVIEKHVTLNKGLDGPDHNFSLVPAEMKSMMELINSMHKAMNGNGFRASDIELNAKSNLRRSLYADGNLSRGDVMTYENIAVKSPGDGIPVKYMSLILGKRIIRNIEDDYPLSWEDFFNA
jgi:N,N'-diacetyllegionaminate synthase